MTTLYIVTPSQYRQHKAHFNQFAECQVMPMSEAISGKIKTWLKNSKVGFDIETSGADPHINRLMLAGFSDGNLTVVIDMRSSLLANWVMYSLIPAVHTLIAHNAGFEWGWLWTHWNLTGRKPRREPELFCTMIADQKLLMGMDNVRFSLVHTLERRGVAVPEAMNKQLQTSFNMDNNTPMTEEQVLYNAADCVVLPELASKQATLIRLAKQEFWIRRIHMRLVKILAEIEHRGSDFDDYKFMQLAEEANRKSNELELKFNNLLREKFPDLDYSKATVSMMDNKAKINRMYERERVALKKNAKYCRLKEREGKTNLKAYQVAKDRVVKAREVLKGLRVEMKKPPVINLSSHEQVLGVFNLIGMNPMPTGRSSTTHKWQQSVSKAARDRWMLANRNHELFEFMDLLNEYQKQSKHVSSFGESFLEKYLHPVTNKVHTSYKQGTVATGRLASGNANGTPARCNSQQIPRNNDIRSCWIAPEGYRIATVDLSGAELITMCSLAQDHKLLELSKGDMHSYFANKGWKAIYKSRGLNWTEQDIISKEQNTDKRTDYKSMTFGTIYGLKASKAGEILNVDPPEGQIAINTIVSEIPDTINMVTQASAFAINHGYVVHNTRTNSRRWFGPALREKQGIASMTFLEEQEIAGAARNTRIQGTQADMLAEAMVMLDKYIKINHLDAWMIMQVHDELVVVFKEEYENWFPEKIRQIMTRSANHYLEGGVQMDSDCKVSYCWVK